VLWELDEHTRACRLFELYLKSVGTDPALAALRDTPKEVLAPLDGPIRARPELRAKWEEVVDLLYDDPGLHQRILDGLEEKDWRERKRDYVRAIEAIRAVRADAAKARMSLGADFATIDEGLARLDGQVQQLGRDLSVSAKLALGYREQGDKAKANALYEKLIAYDPTKPEYLSAKVELTIDEYKETGKVSEEVLKATQIKAAKVRSDSQNGTPVYWTAVIQVMELALALKDPKLVNDRLRFDAVNQSTPADDLQARPRERRDDKRVRRAGNALTVDLCRRYLAIFSQPGVTIPPSFAISEVEIDGKPTQIYLPVEAPKFAPVRRELDDGTVVHFLWEEGKEPPPEPEAAPTPVAVPEAVPAPAAPAPAPEAKP
jgi:tetratricopeptide (TPR) repeat protein